MRWIVLMSLLTAGCLAASPAAAQLPGYAARVYDGGADGQLPYRYFQPAKQVEGERYPLILFLHGAGERGSDNEKQMVHGLADMASPLVQERQPCFIVAPQCPTDRRWVEVSWSDDSHTLPEKPSEPLHLALKLLDQLVEQAPVDRSRIYVTGLSMGGFGTWDALMRRPDFFAAGMPICGGGDEKQAARLKATPLWAFHGGADAVVKPERSRNMIAAIKAAGGEPKYTEYEGVGHNSWSATYRDPAVYEWLFAQRRAAAPK